LLVIVDSQRVQRAGLGLARLIGQVALIGQLIEQRGPPRVGQLVVAQR